VTNNVRCGAPGGLFWLDCECFVCVVNRFPNAGTARVVRSEQRHRFPTGSRPVPVSPIKTRFQPKKAQSTGSQVGSRVVLRSLPRLSSEERFPVPPPIYIGGWEPIELGNYLEGEGRPGGISNPLPWRTEKEVGAQSRPNASQTPRARRLAVNL
jgi:hypothetical protein